MIVSSYASFKSPAKQEETSVFTDPESGNERGLFNLIKTIQWVKLELERRSKNWHLLSTVPTVFLPLSVIFILVFSIQNTIFWSVTFMFFKELEPIWKQFQKKKKINKWNHKIWKGSSLSRCIIFVELFTSSSMFYWKIFKVKDKGKKGTIIHKGSNRIICCNIWDVSGKTPFIMCFLMDVVFVKLNKIA